MKEIDTKDYEVGAIVGRFQLSELHEAHEFLINSVVNNHKKVIILLGVTKALGTPENPIRIPSKENVLDFSSRQYMIQEKYPNAIVVPIQDKGNDHLWSENVDSKIREVFPNEKVLLYGGRDSFMPHYHGVFEVKCLEPEIYISATMVRDNVSKEVLKSPDFRKGQIYHAYQQTPVLYTNYKIALFNEDNDILFCKRHGYESMYSKLNLLSGLAGINDMSYEIGVKRVLGNLVGSAEYIDTKYEISKSNMEFGNKTNKVMNVLLSIKKMYGVVKPQIDFSIQWIKISDLTEDYLKEHIEKEDHEYIQHLIDKYKKPGIFDTIE